ncbi:DUF2059 domain-containing protein [Flavobacterium salilacus subsp. salilacus]|uniref:DUF2059 domain-containing protein n=1 Tax=Flavobacterium TaxID=237 RepID=UPI0010758478|nr:MULTISPECIES: DUF2059 domain-containing protein [Flavobacterium]KAF2514139.1 DUF2059 domain-containing protein [Flavobacterium salilacus subsp. salilacus]MBE1615203.1 DUF2059 domain-containing protein [Flavobacterium sp. SaA2.13]NDI99406.1 DUF2059 domain-containing protein [Flavobacterium salilacus subsp. altitudinum]
MKKLFFAFVFILVAQLGFAQDAAYKADVKKMMELTGSTAQMDMAKKQVIAMIPADKQEAFSKEFEDSLKPVLESQQKFYMTEFTHAEIKDLIKFYESPLGKKLAEKNTKLAEQNMQTMQEWSMELQGIMMKYMQ